MDTKLFSFFPKSRTQSAVLKGKYLFCLLIVLILTLLDGTFTIQLVQRGAWEANPFMRFALSVSHEFFLLVKYFLTAGGLLFLLKNGDMRIFRGLISLEEVAGGILLFYEGLIVYEIFIYHLIL